MKNHPVEASLGATSARVRANITLPPLLKQPHRNATPIPIIQAKSTDLLTLFSVNVPRQSKNEAFRNATVRTACILMLLASGVCALLVPTVVKAESSAQMNVQSIVDSINAIRSSHGLGLLAPNESLRVAAQNHTVDMVTNRNHSHTGTDGSTVRVRIERTGYGSGSWSGENWVALTNPAKAIDWWMNSAPHRANILNRSWQEIGVGAGVNPNSGLHYFVVVFAAKGSGNIAPAVATNLQPPKPATATPIHVPQTHLVQSGETLSAIATRYGLTWQAIATMNNLNEYSILSIGQTVQLPTGNSVGGPSPDQPSVAYAVVSGDTLIDIASRFDTSWEQVALHNNLSATDILSINQVLQIPVDSEEVADGLLAQREPTQPSIPASHVVQPGETIITIALQYNLNWKALLNLNALTDSSLLSVGQTVQLR